ncbi:hypothetical protein KAW11_01855 [Candidatus Bathyarchaeota archaeon]|nr:hypothetical protein [Candidatus Bathyarchaeota archaeon]
MERENSAEPALTLTGPSRLLGYQKGLNWENGKRIYGEKRNAWRRQLLYYRFTGRKVRKERKTTIASGLALPTRPLLAKPNRAFKYRTSKD